jgi:hypothetical protein
MKVRATKLSALTRMSEPDSENRSCKAWFFYLFIFGLSILTPKVVITTLTQD